MRFRGCRTSICVSRQPGQCHRRNGTVTEQSHMQGSDKPRHSQTVAIVLTVVVGADRDRGRLPGHPARARRRRCRRRTLAAGTTLPVETIVLPHDEPELPSGPHQRTFVASCTICHSTRMVMTQPPFPAAAVGGGGSQDGQDLRCPDHPGGGGTDRGLSHDGPGSVTRFVPSEHGKARPAAEESLE